MTGGYCGYHSVIGSGSNEIIYGQIPWPFGSIPNSDTLFDPPPAAVITALKDCQPDGQSNLNLPNGNDTATITQPILSTENNIEVDYADVLINVMSHELNGIITDPNLNGWFDGNGEESPDKCEATGLAPGADPAAWWIKAGFTPAALPLAGGLTNQPIFDAINVTFSDGDTYYLQAEFNQLMPNGGSAGSCVPYGQLLPRFAAAATVDPNQLIGFDPSPTIATMGVQEYQWNFNDGSPAAVITCTTGGVSPTPVTDNPGVPCDPSAFHAFSTPGTYPVTLTVTDYGGNTQSVTQAVKVLGAVPTGSSSGGSSSGGSASASSSSTTSSTTTTTTATTAAAPAIVPPKISQSIVVSSVSKALKSGLLVHYSVTERVAGHFQVLLDARTAKKLGIKTPVVKGVTVAGLANPVEIGTALLETTKAGNDGIAITFSKSAAAKLKRTKSLTLTVRLVASNIAGQQVVVTTTVKLH